MPPIRNGELYRGDLTSCGVFPGVVLSLIIRLTYLGVQITHVLLHTAFVMTSFGKGIAIVCGVPPQVTTLSSIRRSIVIVIIKRVWLLNNSCYKSPLLVSVTILFFSFRSLVWVAIFGFIARSYFPSFLFDDSYSYYPTSLIVNTFDISTRASNLSVKTVFHSIFVYWTMTGNIRSYIIGIWSFL